MADTSIFRRLQRLFQTDVIIRNDGGDQLKVALTNTQPVVATANQYSDLTAPLATTNLVGATPFNLTTTSYLQASGTAKLIIADLVLTASGAVGPFAPSAIIFTRLLIVRTLSLVI